MCPAVCRCEVNYRLTGLLFVALESGVWGPTLSTCHSMRFLSLTHNTLSKSLDSKPSTKKISFLPPGSPALMHKGSKREGKDRWHISRLLWLDNSNNHNNGVKTEMNLSGEAGEGGKKGKSEGISINITRAWKVNKTTCYNRNLKFIACSILSSAPCLVSK